MPHPLQPLTPAEARILGVLIEKSKTTPDVYPLTVNSLTAGCNQKTSREPVMNLSEADVQAAIEELRGRILIMESYGASGRVLRYAHNFGKVYDVPSAAVYLLAVLMLRGAQTASELRANCERLNHFADVSSVEGYLDELAHRQTGAMVVKLPRQAGAREQRWVHLLCGEPPMEAMSGATTCGAAVSDAGAAVSDGKQAALAERVDRLEHEVAELRADIARLIGE